MTVLGQGRFLRLMKTPGGWEYAERVNASGVVFVAALTPERELVLIAQDRPPVQATVIELPAGLAGDGHAHDEPLATAALRELEEETGYTADHLEHVLRGPSSAGLTSETLDLFIARDVRKVSAGGGVGGEGERIHTHLVPLDEVPAWLAARARAGNLIDPKVYTALYFLR